MGKPDDRERRAEETDDVSRRRFLQTMGVGAATAATMREQGLLGKGSAPTRSGADFGPNAVPVRLKVNGETLRLKLEPRVTLLDALRDHIQIDTQEYVDLTGVLSFEQRRYRNAFQPGKEATDSFRMDTMGVFIGIRGTF